MSPLTAGLYAAAALAVGQACVYLAAGRPYGTLAFVLAAMALRSAALTVRGSRRAVRPQEVIDPWNT